jgi:putative MFS transporter
MRDVIARIRAMEPAHRWLLFLLGATSFFDGYDRSIVALALKQIRESFGLSQSAASFWLTFLYLGAIPALWLTRRADRIGRRSVLIFCVVGYTITTGLTAFAPDIGTFVAMQLIGRLFLGAETAVIWTMAAEELPANDRGLGFGVLAMLSALGTGTAAILWGGVFEPAGVSWRVMYLIAVAPLALIGILRRGLPESKRFVALEHTASRWRDLLDSRTRRMFLLVLGTAFLFQLTAQAEIFAIDFLQTDRGLSATAASLMLVGAGLPAIPVMLVAGSLSDRYGRRTVGCGFGFLGLAGGIALFWMPGGIPVLAPALALSLIGQLGSWPIIAGYVTELFPTMVRAQATAWSALAKVAGITASFGLGGVLLALTGSLSPTMTILGIGPLVGMIVVFAAFPDTHGRELEETSIPVSTYA